MGSMRDLIGSAKSAAWVITGDKVPGLKPPREVHVFTPQALDRVVKRLRRHNYRLYYGNMKPYRHRAGAGLPPGVAIYALFHCKARCKCGRVLDRIHTLRLGSRICRGCGVSTRGNYQLTLASPRPPGQKCFLIWLKP